MKGRDNINNNNNKLINKGYILSTRFCDYILRPFLIYGFTPLIFGYGLHYNNEFTMNPFKLIPKILIG
ncbi:mitochondrial import receptor subunit TOM7, putative [Hepatocystis sp. ex Piliocolobus tephrosceles]|nr:mitochondrial import receptor subunit TOM7, putative [Hepatocystis sp. ex Piliocolobus tephrosceles]